MSLWRETTLGHLLRIRHGFAFRGEFFADDGPFVLLTPGNFRAEGGLRLKGEKEKHYIGPVPNDFVLADGDIVVAMTDLTQNAPILGSAAVVPESARYLHNQRLGKVVEVDGLLATREYIYYLFNSPDVRAAIRASATGATVRHTAPERIYRVPVRLPRPAVQKRIAGILSAYDDLIENCERRIRVLDEMARSLYREWFVNFRYPGHDVARLVDSVVGRVPHGWDIRPVAECVVTVGGGTPSRKEDAYWRGGSVPWFSPTDLTSAGAMFMDQSGESITNLGLEKSSAKLFPPMSVMMTSRATIGAIAINTAAACTNQGFITCIPSDRMPLLLLFHWLREQVPLFQRIATGATFKEISRGVFRGLDVVLPPRKIALRFETLAKPMAEQSLALQRTRATLRDARALLLPRLLSGQLSVDAA